MSSTHLGMLSCFRDSGPIRVVDLDSAAKDAPALDGVIKVYEVLSADRYALFLDARRRANDLGISRVWHSNGTVCARRDSESRSIRVTRVADLEHIRRD